MAMFTDFLKNKRTDLGDQVAFSGSDPVVFEGGNTPPQSSSQATFTDLDDH